jgi:hypothetical protein
MGYDKGLILKSDTAAVVCLVAAVLYLICGAIPQENLNFFRIKKDEKKSDVNDEKNDEKLEYQPFSSQSRACVSKSHKDLLFLGRKIPKNLVIDTRKQSTRTTITVGNDEVMNMEDDADTTVGDNNMPPSTNNNETTTKSSPVAVKKQEDDEDPDDIIRRNLFPPVTTEAVDEDGVPLSSYPVMDKCKPNGPEFIALKKAFPGLSIGTYVRFLVARKGNVELASKMLTNHLNWRKENLPIPSNKIDAVLKCLDTGICIPYGRAKDGSPIMVFRGAFYDKKIASPEDYALAFAYAIEETLRNTGELSITVLANARAFDGAPNAPAELAFVKKLISTLSDNFPERLKKTVLFPMPWYARVMKSAVSMFMDPRSMSKIIFSGHDANHRAPEVEKCIDWEQLPEIVGGTNTRLLPSMGDKLRRQLAKKKQ